MADDKTEEATPRRLRRAQEDGDSGVSSFAGQALAFVVAVAVVPASVAALFAWGTARVRDAVSHASDKTIDAHLDGAAIGGDLLTLVLPIFLVVAVTSAVVQLVQSGGAFAVKRVGVKLERLNPIEGFRNLFSGQRLFSVARSLLSAAVLSYLAYGVLRSHLVDLSRLTESPEQVSVVIEALARRLARDFALLGLVIGALDLLVTRRAWRKRLRMSKDEVKREHRESEGDPHVKQARERAHKEMLEAATVGSVRNATVVVTNPVHLACALRYHVEGGDEAPVVVASGDGELARGIVRAAHAYGVPVVEDVPLAHALKELAVGAKIPEALYEAVAEILREVSGRADGG